MHPFCHLQQILVFLLVLPSGVSAAISLVEGPSSINHLLDCCLTRYTSRWSFNLTLLMSGVFGLAAGGSHNFVTLASLYAVVGVGCGGNMPVDSAVFLGKWCLQYRKLCTILKSSKIEFIPASHQYLLTVLSIWWTFGALICSLVAWPLIANFSCESAEGCTKSENMGWRYLIFILGGIIFIMWILRACVFRLYKSPRYLVSRGEDEKAIHVLQTIARINGVHCSLTVEQLRAAGINAGASSQVTKGAEKRGILAVTKSVLSESMTHVKALFASRKMAWSTSLLIYLWGKLALIQLCFEQLTNGDSQVVLVLLPRCKYSSIVRQCFLWLTRF